MTAQRLYKLTATVLGVPRRAVLRDAKVGAVRWPVIQARHAAWWLARDVLGMSWRELGRHFGESPQRIRYGVRRTTERRIDCARLHAATDAARDWMRYELNRETRAA